MRNSLRYSRVLLALAIAATACSRSSGSAEMSDDLKQDLAKVGGSDMQLAGAPSTKLDVVSASERTNSPTPAPKAPHVAKAAVATRGIAAPAPRPKAEEPAAAPAPAKVETQTAPVVVNEPVPQQSWPAAGRPQAPSTHTNPEPRGGWKTPGQVIRGAPFPINP